MLPENVEYTVNKVFKPRAVTPLKSEGLDKGKIYIIKLNNDIFSKLTPESEIAINYKGNEIHFNNEAFTLNSKLEKAEKSILEVYRQSGSTLTKIGDSDETLTIAPNNTTNQRVKLISKEEEDKRNERTVRLLDSAPKKPVTKKSRALNPIKARAPIPRSFVEKSPPRNKMVAADSHLRFSRSKSVDELDKNEIDQHSMIRNNSVQIVTSFMPERKLVDASIFEAKVVNKPETAGTVLKPKPISFSDESSLFEDVQFSSPDHPMKLYSPTIESVILDKKQPKLCQESAIIDKKSPMKSPSVSKPVTIAIKNEMNKIELSEKLELKAKEQMEAYNTIQQLKSQAQAIQKEIKEGAFSPDKYTTAPEALLLKLERSIENYNELRSEVIEMQKLI